MTTCFTFTRIDPESLEITLKYNTNGGPKWAEGDLECTIPFEVLSDQAVRDADGTVTLQEDPDKLAARTAQAWLDLRSRRNSLLAASDYTQLQDAHLSAEKKSAWADYRQALRDLPENATDPTQVTWPVSPSQ
jgi:hypothetical protein